MQAEIRSENKKPETKRKFDVIIIGAGPAGYTASIYTSRAKRDTLIISGVLPGGQLMLTTEVENYPGFAKGILGPELMTAMREQAVRIGTTIIDDEVVNVDFRHKPFKILTYSEEYEADTVIIATGATPRKIGVKGEQEFSARGVSYCGTSD
ncbi:MAG: FAD-dependent oxidoreductase, partial [Candidatus Nitrosotalea sp.]|nr:FAD-dependent oxidoreductase [Candidatus Nitrosotalea sp.]